MAGPQPPVSIIGAGLAGLVLGRGLRKSGIRAVLYERHAEVPRFQYGITLQRPAFQRLLKVLDIDEPEFRQRVSVDAPNNGNVYPVEESTGSDDGAFFRAQRGRLEQLLREGLDVKWEYTLTDIKASKAGGIDMVFANKKTIQSLIVIATEGPHSPSRRILSPDTAFNILPFVVFNGKCRVHSDHFKKIYKPVFKEGNIAHLLRGDVRLEIAVNEMQGDGMVSISYTYSRPARSNDPLHKPDRPMTSAKDIPAEFYDEIDGSSGLEQPFAEIFSAQKLKQERVLHWLMRTVNPPADKLEELARQGLLFLGDSIHAQPILGGRGANAAVEDGLDLADHVQNHGVHDLPSFYTPRRLAEWNKGVKESEKSLAELHNAPKAAL
ncbi:MAG: hypothetical protein M1820_007592 [Bogoriella megaspora]|nr:MAG: hypothetical protein M1820_007592 [Bogoriella megaspora]